MNEIGFIETLAIFCDNPDLEYSKDYWTKFTFDINKIVDYNESSEGYTTIELTTGFRQTIAIKYDKFKTLCNINTKTLIDDKANFEYGEQ